MAIRTEQRWEDQPYIDVVLLDGTSDVLPPKALDVLLENGHVHKFRRSNGWVTVGVVPVRAKRREDICPLYDGPERRRVSH